MALPYGKLLSHARLILPAPPGLECMSRITRSDPPVRTRLFQFLLVPALLLLPATSAIPSASACVPGATGAACCKVCRKGKPCGDTCIARSKTCHVGRGCACAAT